ncbi:hypothetical protein SmJEL517_g03005 [Synchytrium microbalum]|uniref:Uncharacterized protein n=1 Tax=Synchytrium microbalum TaxID=1806994 RepID=A0A507BZY2_9FUNG|nr:uncharacterized protein SmJEL517_g03005 [Synchytrium microbalum]TPX34367.1 hypothetical protein SmJEL517_g03005 [Synchytrium microbalum]
MEHIYEHSWEESLKTDGPHIVIEKAGSLRTLWLLVTGAFNSLLGVLVGRDQLLMQRFIVLLEHLARWWLYQTVCII